MPSTEIRSVQHCELPLIDTFSDVIPGCPPELVDVLIQQCRATYLGRGHKRTKPYPGVSETLEALGGRKATATTKGTDGFLCKPAPDGDSPADMEAGRRAGVKTCAVRYGYGDPGKLAEWQPDYWVDELRQLL